MALIVENGTIVPNAESYISVADADTYFDNRGKGDAWGEADNKENLLRMATDYMVQMYRSKWNGYRVSSLQALDWPRAYVERPDEVGGWPSYVPQNEIPKEIKNACAELAFRAMSGDLTPDITPEDLAKRLTVGPITIEYDISTSSVVIFRQIDLMVQPYFKRRGMGIPLVRT